MCQLIFINSNDKDINTALLISQLLIDTETSHKDGFGVFLNEKDLQKTKETPHYFEDLGISLKNCINTNKPILAHVRLASSGQEISNIKSHPFESPNFILAHNGTLELSKEYTNINKTKEQTYKDAKLIDSEVFLHHLDIAYKEEKKDFVKAINKAMSDFTGKFAFLIYEKAKSKFYAVRGNSADLHWVNLLLGTERKPIGYIINTEEKSLRNSLDIASAFLRLNDKMVNYNEKEVLNLEDESIFELTKDAIKKIGDIKENKKIWVNDYGRGNYGRVWGKEDYVAPYPKKDTKFNYDTEIDRVINFMETYGLGIKDIDLLFTSVMGVPLSYIDSKDTIDIFINKVLPKFVCKKELRKEVVKYVEDVHINLPLTFYVDNKIQYPYMLNRTNFKEVQKKVAEERRRKIAETERR